MVSARKPVPYDKKVVVISLVKSMYEFNKSNAVVRGKHPADLNVEDDYYERYDIERGRQVYIDKVYGRPYYHDVVGDRSKRIYVESKVRKVVLEIQPWSGTGNNPYNVGKVKLALKP